MLCNTLHDFCEIACSSCRGSFPTPTISRSITNFGIVFSLDSAVGHAKRGPCEHSEASDGTCIEANAPTRVRYARRSRDKSPGLAGTDKPAGAPEARVAGPDNGLIAVLHADLVE